MNKGQKIREALMFILTERECPNCKKYFQPTNMRHTFCSKKCSGEYYSTNTFPTSKKYEHLKQNDGTYKCPHCDRIFTTMHGLHPHVWYNHTKEGKKFISSKRPEPWNKNLTKETDERVRKISKKNKGENHWLGKHHTEESKRKISERRKAWFQNGGTNSNAGNSKKYRHHSPVAGNVSLDGTWELRVAIFFDGSELDWRRNVKGFSYINPKTNKISIYYPDFYVYDWDTYIEVKGYISEVDQAKWSQFPESLEIWDKNKLKTYGILP